MEGTPLTRTLTVIALLFATIACTPIGSKGENTGAVGKMVGGLNVAALVYKETKKDNDDNNPNPICRSPCGPSAEACITVCAE